MKIRTLLAFCVLNGTFFQQSYNSGRYLYINLIIRAVFAFKKEAFTQEGGIYSRRRHLLKKEALTQEGGTYSTYSVFSVIFIKVLTLESL